MAPIRIDGSTLEGGGQVLRVAIACAVVHGRPVTVHSIRGGRSKPGLKAQHLKGLEMVASVCGGRMEGATMDSMEVTLTPRHIRPGHYLADTQTAGSVTLLLQAVLPCTLYAKGPTQLTLRGGTNADMAPPVDYTAEVFVPVAAKFGVKLSLNTVRRGFFPRGGGEVQVDIAGLTTPLKAVTLVDRGRVTRVGGLCYVAGLPPRLAATAVQAAVSMLKRRLQLGSDVKIDVRQEVVSEREATGKGFGILLWCTTDTGVTLGSCTLGTTASRRGPGTPAEELGSSAATQLCEDIEQGVCVDREMQNQIILLMGLAAGRSTVLCGPLSLHTQTAMQIMQQTTQAKFTTEEQGDLVKIVCDGIGLNPDSLPCTT